MLEYLALLGIVLIFGFVAYLVADSFGPKGVSIGWPLGLVLFVGGIFIATMAGSGWPGPIAPPMRGLYWIGPLTFAVLVAIALVVARRPYRKDEEIDADSEPWLNVATNASLVIALTVLMIFLFIAVALSFLPRR